MLLKRTSVKIAVLDRFFYLWAERHYCLLITAKPPYGWQEDLLAFSGLLSLRMRCLKMILFGTNVCCLMMQCFVATFLSEVPNVAPITALGHL